MSRATGSTKRCCRRQRVGDERSDLAPSKAVTAVPVPAASRGGSGGGSFQMCQRHQRRPPAMPRTGRLRHGPAVYMGWRLIRCQLLAGGGYGGGGGSTSGTRLGGCAGDCAIGNPQPATTGHHGAGGPEGIPLARATGGTDAGGGCAPAVRPWAWPPRSRAPLAVCVCHHLGSPPATSWWVVGSAAADAAAAAVAAAVITRGLHCRRDRVTRAQDSSSRCSFVSSNFRGAPLGSLADACVWILTFFILSLLLSTTFCMNQCFQSTRNSHGCGTSECETWVRRTATGNCILSVLPSPWIRRENEPPHRRGRSPRGSESFTPCSICTTHARTHGDDPATPFPSVRHTLPRCGRQICDCLGRCTELHCSGSCPQSRRGIAPSESPAQDVERNTGETTRTPGSPGAKRTRTTEVTQT